MEQRVEMSMFFMLRNEMRLEDLAQEMGSTALNEIMKWSVNRSSSAWILRE